MTIASRMGSLKRFSKSHEESIVKAKIIALIGDSFSVRIRARAIAVVNYSNNDC